MSELYTPAEVARLLKVSRRKVYDLLSSGEIPTVRIGSGPKPPLRVRSSELDAYVRKGGSVAADRDSGDAGANRESARTAAQPRRTRRAAKTVRASVKARGEVLS